MRVIETKIPEVLIIEPQVYEDDRGFFYESYSRRRYVSCGVKDIFVQDNHSGSKGGVIRGLHYQASPGQAKLVRVAVGEVFDVAVDIRYGSPTYGEWVGVTLSAENRLQLYIPVGFAHGFCVTSDIAEFLYRVSSYYAPEEERGIAWDDPDLSIDWPVQEPILSKRDRHHPRLCDAPRDYVYRRMEE
ncbi:MAG: dTDP-4-dehydrorhamnose 3,5-epimerase [Anaerolineales bacterium]